MISIKQSYQKKIPVDKISSESNDKLWKAFPKLSDQISGPIEGRNQNEIKKNSFKEEYNSQQSSQLSLKISTKRNIKSGIPNANVERVSSNQWKNHEVNYSQRFEEDNQDLALMTDKIDKQDQEIQAATYQRKAHKDTQTWKELTVQQEIQTLEIHKNQECQTFENLQVHQSVQVIQKDKGDLGIQTEQVLEEEREVQTYT